MKTIITIAFLLISLCSFSQEYLNLDFETKIPQTGIPDIWYVGGKGYESRVDSNVKVSGKYSLRMKNTSSTNRVFGVANTKIPINLVKGKTLVVKGNIKTECITDGYAGLWLRDGLKASSSYSGSKKKGIKGSSDWQEVSIKLEISKKATDVYFGCINSGEGTAWFDSFEIYIDSIKHIEKVQEIILPTSEELDWLKRNIIPLNTFEPDSDNNDDLELLSETIGNARIVALGEVTHGSSEIYKMKHRIIKHLCSNNGFDVFSIEANMPVSYWLNDYVQEDKEAGSLETQGWYAWPWNTHEVLDMIKWMHDYNLKNENKVAFTGFDMQLSWGAIIELRKYVTDDGLKSLDKLAEKIKRKNPKSFYQPVNERAKCNKELKQLNKWISSNIEDDNKKKWAIQNVRIIEQSLEFIRETRDKYMAENVSWIAEQNPKSKMVLWAHNGHIRKTKNRMGQYLSEKYEDDYLTIGFAFHKGCYAVNGESGVVTVSAQESYAGTYEYFFQSINEPLFLLDLRNIKSDEKAGNWILENLKFRLTGAAKMENEFYSTSITDDFDIIIFINESSNSKLVGDK